MTTLGGIPFRHGFGIFRAADESRFFFSVHDKALRPLFSLSPSITEAHGDMAKRGRATGKIEKTEIKRRDAIKNVSHFSNPKNARQIVIDVHTR
jgi:hypothetical protein